MFNSIIFIVLAAIHPYGEGNFRKPGSYELDVKGVDLYELSYLADFAWLDLEKKPAPQYYQTYTDLVLKQDKVRFSSCNKMPLYRTPFWKYHLAFRYHKMHDQWGESFLCAERGLSKRKLSGAFQIVSDNMAAAAEHTAALARVPPTQFIHMQNYCENSWMVHEKGTYVGVRGHNNQCKVFLIDTGASYTSALADVLDVLPLGGDGDNGAGFDFVHAETLTGFYGFGFSNLPVGIITGKHAATFRKSFMRTERGRYPLSGVIGLQTLKHLLISWDPKTKKIFLVPRLDIIQLADKRKIPLAYNSRSLHLKITGATGPQSHTFSCMLDTGATKTTLSEDIAMKLAGADYRGVDTAAGKVYVNHPLSGTTYETQKLYPIAVVLGDVALTLENINLSPEGYSSCTVGWQDLRRFPFVIDIRGRALYLGKEYNAPE